MPPDKAQPREATRGGRECADLERFRSYPTPNEGQGAFCTAIVPTSEWFRLVNERGGVIGASPAGCLCHGDRIQIGSVHWRLVGRAHTPEAGTVRLVFAKDRNG